ncbi:hypothetical protein GF373_08415 [bacterium]|nr:hypothetical protein [bacterium]
MTRHSSLKLLDILSLQPGSLLHLNAVRKEPECDFSERFMKSASWRQKISTAISPEGDTQKQQNLSKLLDIAIDTQILVKYPETNVVEIFRLDESTWSDLRSRAGQHVQIMIDGRIFAEGEIVDSENQSGILIKKLTSVC